jgi:transposase-like protein
MTRKRQPTVEAVPPKDGLSSFACPNEDCCHFNRFDAGNLSICEQMGKHKSIRRLYCKSCGHRFSERQGSLLARSKLPQETVVRIVKCLGHGCSIEATADICEADPRTVELLLSKAGSRAEDFHRLQLDRLTEPIQAVEIDELQGALAGPKKGAGVEKLAMLVERIAARAERGFTWLWR